MSKENQIFAIILVRNVLLTVAAIFIHIVLYEGNLSGIQDVMIVIAVFAFIKVIAAIYGALSLMLQNTKLGIG